MILANNTTNTITSDDRPITWEGVVTETNTDALALSLS